MRSAGKEAGGRGSADEEHATSRNKLLLQRVLAPERRLGRHGGGHRS